MTGPRDAPTALVVAVDFETGQPVSDRQKQRLQALKEASELLYMCMHEADGSVSPGEHQEHVFSGTRMRQAAGLIDTALMIARRAALETP